MKMQFLAAVALLGLTLSPLTVQASTATDGYVVSLQHYSGHIGILIKLDSTMIDPDNCGRTDWYIMPDDSPHAQFVQAMLLSAQATHRQVHFALEGCLQGIAEILAVWN